MALIAGDVKLPNDLSSVFSGVGSKASGNIKQNYGNAMDRSTQEAGVQGFAGGPLDYTKQRMGTQEGLDLGTLNSGLGMGLGNAGYEDTLNQRDFNQKKQIADMLGDAASPSTLQEVFAGIGGGAKAGAQLAPLMMGGGNGFSMGDSPFPQGDSTMSPGFSYPAYKNNPYLGGGF